ncbi:hypothetical protein MSAN_01750100 [Mycena sanguinolenta]|uniref:Uncharacterized protein n=1 Tax=Mycena sanguinolenta TaxID=230812 RepID=A0A8H7CRX5_9AGAR|nr:hypothetical protein MSAN_01750100 [Mycena sanguinolenta]
MSRIGFQEDQGRQSALAPSMVVSGEDRGGPANKRTGPNNTCQAEFELFGGNRNCVLLPFLHVAARICGRRALNLSTTRASHVQTTLRGLNSSYHAQSPLRCTRAWRFVEEEDKRKRVEGGENESLICIARPTLVVHLGTQVSPSSHLQPVRAPFVLLASSPPVALDRAKAPTTQLSAVQRDEVQDGTRAADATPTLAFPSSLHIALVLLAPTASQPFYSIHPHPRVLCSRSRTILHPLLPSAPRFPLACSFCVLVSTSLSLLCVFCVACSNLLYAPYDRWLRTVTAMHC